MDTNNTDPDTNRIKNDEKIELIPLPLWIPIIQILTPTDGILASVLISGHVN